MLPWKPKQQQKCRKHNCQYWAFHPHTYKQKYPHNGSRGGGGREGIETPSLGRPSRLNLHWVLIYVDVYLDLNFTPVTALQPCCLIYVHKTSYIYKTFVLSDNIGVLTIVNKQMLKYRTICLSLKTFIWDLWLCFIIYNILPEEQEYVYRIHGKLEKSTRQNHFWKTLLWTGKFVKLSSVIAIFCKRSTMPIL